MNGAVLDGDLEMVEFLYENWSLRRFPACNDDYPLVQGSSKSYPPAPARKSVGNSELDARRDHVGVIQLICGKTVDGCDFPFTIDKAVQNGQLDVVKSLHENTDIQACTASTMNTVAWRGHLDIVKSLHDNQSEGCSANTIDYAAISGHFGIVEFLHKNRTEGCSKRAMDGAAAGGHLDTWRSYSFSTTIEAKDAPPAPWTTLQLEVTSRYSSSSTGITVKVVPPTPWTSLRFGHLDAARFLHEDRSEGCTSAAMDYACIDGNLDVIHFLHEDRAEGYTAKAVLLAVQNDHHEVLDFLFANCVALT